VGRGARIGIAIVLLLTLLVAPVVRIEMHGKIIEVGYGPVSFATGTYLLGTIIGKQRLVSSDLISMLEEFDRSGELPMEVNLLSLLMATIVGLIFAVPIGAILALFSRSGFALALIGSIFLFLILMGAKTIVPDYGIFLIMILSIIGLVLGRP